MDIGPLSWYYVDIGHLSRYYVDIGTLSRYYVDMCPHSSQNLLVPSSLPDKYTDMYGLIYQLLNRQNNLSHIFNSIKACIVYGNLPLSTLI